MPTLQKTFDCDHPVALITGSGAPRVGRVVAEHLAKAGCNIALHANNSVEGAEETAKRFRDQFDCQAIVTRGSLEDDSVPERLVTETQQHFGRIDIVVNSAAIWHPTPLNQITPDEMRRYFNINTLATFFLARAAGSFMATQPCGGTVVNLGDWATVRPYLDHAAYFPSKGGVEVLTKSLAIELAQLNQQIRVNCIQPGPVLLANDVSDDEANQLARTTLVGRIGTPEDVAHAVQFLCENSFVTGICLPVDGGRTIFAPDGMQVGMNTG
ncbi:MAG: SDR family oxidoreductase [Rubripirellula sp.]|jgi:NAD(P)-dependent dehydrogenase (short-subunit alcohol dehydrogenase family)|nr:SDR family oxidoreductase [Planctomycetaceae bacterium]MDF1840962.1 SDR family oxidoreductase [Rubripirellula sp.]